MIMQIHQEAEERFFFFLNQLPVSVVWQKAWISGVWVMPLAGPSAVQLTCNNGPQLPPLKGLNLKLWGSLQPWDPAVLRFRIMGYKFISPVQ